MPLKKVHFEIGIEIVENFPEHPDADARIYYPDEGNKIEIIKGLNTVEVSEAFRHEIGHLIDWYVSNGKQSSQSEIRERNAEIIANAL